MKCFYSLLISLSIMAAHGAFAGQIGTGNTEPKCSKRYPILDFNGKDTGVSQYIVRLGEQVCLKKNTVKVQFTRALQDNRCPIGSNCELFVGSKSVIRVAIKAPKKKTTIKKLTISSNIYDWKANRLVFGQTELYFKELFPYPGDQYPSQIKTAVFFSKEAGIPFPSSDKKLSASNDVNPPAQCPDENTACTQVLTCGKMPDGHWQLFSTPCDAKCAGAVEMNSDSAHCEAQILQ